MGSPVRQAFLIIHLRWDLHRDGTAPNLLQLPDCNVLLVLGFSPCMGCAESHRYLLVSPARILGGNHLPRGGVRLRSQLVQESNVALCSSGPLFLLTGVVFLLSDMRIIAVDPRLVWPILSVLTGYPELLSRSEAKPASMTDLAT